MYCVIKCIKTKRVLKGKFVSSVFHGCNAKTQICITGPQCVNILWLQEKEPQHIFWSPHLSSPPQWLTTEPLQRETLHSQSSLYPSLKVPSRPVPCQVPQQAPAQTDARLQSLFHLPSRVPSKRALPPCSFTELS
jgi:hypothetical protein